MRRPPLLAVLLAVALLLPACADGDGDEAEEDGTGASTSIELEEVTGTTATTLAPLAGDDVEAFCAATARLRELDEQSSAITDPVFAVPTDPAPSPEQQAALVASIDEILTLIPAFEEAYTDIEAVLPAGLASRVATLREFSVSATERMAEATSYDELQAIVDELTVDPDATEAGETALEVDAYARQECGQGITGQP